MPAPTAAALKKIAFVAMPFGTKSTGLKPGAGPESVNFDALWNEAVKPALVELGYMPLRADEQSGSVIVKDMLNALVHADLVLADISLANGNVYYEAGIRHAARESGCILIKANWARPLFDLKQITQVRYPMAMTTPIQADYQQIKTVLVDAIPPLADSTGPVYELVQGVDSAGTGDTWLRERTQVLFEFDTELASARISATQGDKEPLREMLVAERIQYLPSFAIRELVDAVRDNLNWSNLTTLIDSLPALVRNEPHMREQKALGLSLGGNMPDAIAIFEALIKRDGKTCLRLGNLGGMYRRLAMSSNARQRTRYTEKAIASFREGQRLDLNDYYCSHKLLVMLLDRDDVDDGIEAQKVDALLGAACERACNVAPEAEWLVPTLLIHAFYQKNMDKIQECIRLLRIETLANWQLTVLLTDLYTVLGLSMEADPTDEIDSNKYDTVTEAMLEVCSEIRSWLPINQDVLLEIILPLLKSTAKVHQKQGSVEARLAVAGEEIVSVPETGEETSLHAGEGDVVINNNTNAKEQYIVGAVEFENRYESDQLLSVEFQSFKAKGKALAIEINHEMTTMLSVGTEFFVHASWGSEQYAQEGDYFVCPLPAEKEIYRVDKSTFESTYVAVD